MYRFLWLQEEIVRVNVTMEVVGILTMEVIRILTMEVVGMLTMEVVGILTMEVDRNYTIQKVLNLATVYRDMNHYCGELL